MTDEELKTACDAVQAACLEIRNVLATCDLSEEEGIANAMRDVRVQAEKVEDAANKITGAM